MAAAPTSKPQSSVFGSSFGLSSIRCLRNIRSTCTNGCWPNQQAPELCVWIEFR
ncbi:unnamed protein product [Boreogadus saida]